MKTLITIILLTLPSYMINAADFEVLPGHNEGSTYIKLTGPIRLGDNQKLKKLLDHNKNTYAIRLISPGGSVNVAIDLAETIRKHDLVTHLASSDECASACVLVFLGGSYRHAYKSSRLGIHPSKLNTVNADESINDVFDSGQTSGMKMAHFWAKYVKAGKEYEVIKFLNNIYKTTDYKSMHWADNEKLKELSVITYLKENK